jgi:hypothetical protein
MRLLAKHPAQRHQSAQELWADLGQVLRQHGSLPAGNSLDPMIQRALVRRKLTSRPAPVGREALVEQAQEPSGETQRTTVVLAPNFIAPSPASPSARPPATVGPMPDVHGTERPTVDLPRGFVPVERMPFPLAPPAPTVSPVPIRTAALPRANVPPAREPFPLAKPRRAWQRAAQAGGIALLILAGFALLMATATVFAARMLQVAPTKPAESAAPIMRAAPAVSTSVELSAPPAPSFLATAAPAAPPPSATAPAPPAKSVTPVRTQPASKPRVVLF